MMDRQELYPEGLRFLARAVRGGYNPPGVPSMLEGAAAEMERIATLEAELAASKAEIRELHQQKQQSRMDLRRKLAESEAAREKAEAERDKLYSMIAYLMLNKREIALTSLPDRARQVQELIEAATAYDDYHETWRKRGTVDPDPRDESILRMRLHSAVSAITKDATDG